MPSRRVVVAGGAGALALTTLGYRAWDRGVFSGPTGPAYAPWDEWRGSDLDANRRPLRSAVLAASPHNTQPWLLAVSATAITVYADRARHLDMFDPFRREMHLGLGCAIENLVRAARAFGMTIDTQPMIDRNQMLGRKDDFGPALASFARVDGWEPTFVFRVGYAGREAPRSPRRPLEDVVALSRSQASKQ